MLVLYLCTSNDYGHRPSALLRLSSDCARRIVTISIVKADGEVNNEPDGFSEPILFVLPFPLYPAWRRYLAPDPVFRVTMTYRTCLFSMQVIALSAAVATENFGYSKGCIVCSSDVGVSTHS